MNRIQNESFVCKCTENTNNEWKCHIKHQFEQKNGWIKEMPQGSRIFNKNGTSVATIEPCIQEDGRTYDQLILIDWMKGTHECLTKGKFVVTQVLAHDELFEKFYFIGTKENTPGVRHLYSVDNGDRNIIRCLTCDLKVSRGQISKCRHLKKRKNLIIVIVICFTLFSDSWVQTFFKEFLALLIARVCMVLFVTGI